MLIWMTRLWPSLIGAVQVVQPETILRWHRAGFKVFWRWKLRTRVGRPKIDRSLRDLIRHLEAENTALRHHMIVLLRQVCGRVRLTDNASPKTMKCCAGSFEPMLDITMTSERIGH